MVVRSKSTAPPRPGYAGLRLSVDEYFALPDDGNRYELIDGVVVMSPSPTPGHQHVALCILHPLVGFVWQRQLGSVLYETDICLGHRPNGEELVYRPEIIFIAAERVPQIGRRIEFAPDVVVEVISPESRSLDTQTKFDDYERAGVREYWLIDPVDQEFAFYGLSDRRYEEMPLQGDRFESRAVPGFTLDLAAVRASFRAIGGA